MRIIYLIKVLCLALISSICFANDQAILTVTGDIANTNQPDKKSYVFSFDELSKLTGTVVRTKTLWTPLSDFKGPLIRDILNTVGTSQNAEKVELITLDSFAVTIPISDFKRWDVILAYSQNGQRLKRATKGPLFVIYPVDQYPLDLKNNLTRSKLVWGINKIVVLK
jgi:hypothetical protein